MTNFTANIHFQSISLTQLQFEQLKMHLSQLEWSVFLDSASADHVDSQWSILSAMPIATLQSASGTTFFKQGEIEQESCNDPFQLLTQKRQAVFGKQQSCSELPFSGGVLGSINYELGYQFEDISNADNPKALPLAELSLGFYDWALIYNQHLDEFSLLTCETQIAQKSAQQYWQQRFDWLMTQLNNKVTLASFKLLNEWQSNMSKTQYREKFNQIQAYILSGDCYQVNLAQRFKAKYLGDEYKAYQALLAENSPPFAAFLRLPEQVILSLSPERFLKLEGDTVETKPIKGTRPRYKDISLDKQSMSTLQKSEKDRSENLMIVDLLRNDIGRVCQPGSVKVPRLFDIESFPAVHHLVSTVTGKLASKYQVEDLIKACFPGGSITGAPKIRAMEIIAELEPDRRQSYCGSIGYISNNGKMDMNIAIRTLICSQGHIYCWAGGGLVADSQVDAEYQECFDKVSKILPCLTDL